MKIIVLASGSRGNSTYIEKDNTKLLIDIGVSCAYIEKELKELKVNPKHIDGILITHNHSDHISGITTFCKKYKTKVYVSSNLEKEIEDYVEKELIKNIKKEMTIKDINIKVIKTSHDIESYGYIIDDRVVHITDTGYINNKYFNMLRNKEVYILESNHDIEMLINGNYPYHLKQRILSDKGHLSNDDCSYYLSKLMGDNTKYVVLAHLSEQNNTREKALEKYNNKNKNKKIEVIIAEQSKRTKTIKL